MKPLGLLLGGVLFVAGCSTSVTMDAASVTKFADGNEWIMSGELLGRIDGSSVTRLAGNGLSCELEQTRQADRSTAGIMNCIDADGKLVYSERQRVPADQVKMAFHGTYVAPVSTPFGPGMMAFGWGKHANSETLRALLP